MPKHGSTDIVVILDRSGSMSNVRSDMEGGFDAFIAEQKKIHGECHVTLTQFDDQYDVVYLRKPLAEVPNLVLAPRGGTALYDAMGRTIAATGQRLAALPEHERPEHVCVIVITDGCENASKEYRREQVVAAVRHQTDVYKWRFVFLGADMDAMAVGGSLGIANAVATSGTGIGARALYASVSNSMSATRQRGKAFDITQAQYNLEVEREQKR